MQPTAAEIENRHKTLTALMIEFRKKSLAERRAMIEQIGAVPPAEGCSIESLDLDGVPAEKITPAVVAPGRVLLYLHGGGYVLGNLASHRHMVSRFAVAAGRRSPADAPPSASRTGSVAEVRWSFHRDQSGEYSRQALRRSAAPAAKTARPVSAARAAR